VLPEHQQSSRVFLAPSEVKRLKGCMATTVSPKGGVGKRKLFGIFSARNEGGQLR